MTTILGIFSWIGEHSNKVAAAIRAFFYMGVVLTWWHWTAEQMAAVMLFVEAGLALFVETNTVSKVRVGERIQEGMEKERTGTSTGMIAIFALAGSMLLLTGCAGNPPPNTSLEGKLAVHGVQVIDGLRATLPALKALVCRPDVPSVTCVTPADADKIAANIGKAADYGTELAAILKIIDATPSVDEKLSNAAKARQVLANIQRLLTEATVTPAHEETRNQLVQLFSNLTLLLFTAAP